MQISQERILTTHVGSLPRSKAVTDLVFAKEREETVDEAVFHATIKQAIYEVVARQKEVGVDIVSDGEMLHLLGLLPLISLINTISLRMHT